MNTTNAEQPFAPGDIIELMPSLTPRIRLLVLRNYGESGKVRQWPLSEAEALTVHWDDEFKREWRKVGVLE